LFPRLSLTGVGANTGKSLNLGHNGLSLRQRLSPVICACAGLNLVVCQAFTGETLTALENDMN
jgi:hypothetical protein